MRLLSSVVLVIALAGTASAQESRIPPVQIQPGARVRVSAPTVGRTSGRVIVAAGDSLTLVRDRTSDTLRLATSDLQSLEISVGRHKRRWAGAGLGFLAGAAVGTVVGLATYEKPKDCAGQMLCDLGPGFDATFGALLFGAGGAITGAVLGAGKADDWEPVATPARTSLELFIRPATRPRLGLSLRF